MLHTIAAADRFLHIVSSHSYAGQQILIHIDVDLGHKTQFGETHLDWGLREFEGYVSFVPGHVL